jgi:diguanylate cyclase (GGDEF)-like protein
VAVFSDISGIKRSQAQLAHQAQHDPLTGLPNRLLFKDRLEHALSRAERTGAPLALLFLDLDRFKHVNDTFGHAVGDQLLQEVSRRLEAAVRREDTVARLGGDEFTILLEDLRRPEDAAVLARKLLAALAEPCQIAGHDLRVTTSIGIGIHPRDGTTAAELLAHADAAMYLAKGDGRDGYRFYTPELTAAALQRVRLESELRGAIECNELLVHYQPQLELGSRRLVGAEALVRWRHPQNGLMGPDHFIPAAEDSGLIVDIGAFVLREACRQAREWSEGGIGLDAVAVNVSATQIRRSDFVGMVQAVLEETGLPASGLELEVTEDLILDLAEAGSDALHVLGGLGVRLAIDDFGRGCSSLARLGRLPIRRLKIDRSFVAALPADQAAAAVARAATALAGSLGLEVVAEGVETPAQAALLQQHGCRHAQGFLFGRPVAAGEFARCWRDLSRVNSGASSDVDRT